jgi:hypothetical protein
VESQCEISRTSYAKKAARYNKADWLCVGVLHSEVYNAARKARAAKPAPGAIKVTKRKVGGSVGRGEAIMQYGANVTTTIKVAMRDGQAKRAEEARRIKRCKEG